MRRREFFSLATGATGMALLGAHAPGWAQAVAGRAAGAQDRILVLIELKGGNDGINTVVPFADPLYATLRPTIAIAEADVVKLDERVGLHPALRPLMATWDAKELAIVQGVGYPQPNLSHFRSIEIWETASRSNEYLADGWLARALAEAPLSTHAWTADGVRIGAGPFGPLAGARAVSLADPEAFVQQARLASPREAGGNEALAHLLRVENDANHAAAGLRGDRFAFTTPFPAGGFGNSVRAAAQVLASQRSRSGVPVVTLSLGSFDTHQNQPGAQANLLKQLADGLIALKGALGELGLWDRTVAMTFSEFGRRPRQNRSNGTDHGTAAPHFVMGGAVLGGLYGTPPDFARLDRDQNLAYGIDFRQLYATLAKDWWGVAADPVVRGRFDSLPLLRT